MKKKYLYLITMILLFVMGGCSDDTITENGSMELSNSKTIETKSANIVTEKVGYKSYEEGIVNQGYSSSVLYYPDVPTIDNLPVVVIMHGYMGKKERLAFIGQELAKRGFASLVITASNSKKVITNPKDWVYNFDVAFESIKGENERKESPLYHKLALNKINIVAHSMGAGGAIYFADQASPKHTIKSIVAMAPYSLEINKPGGNTYAPTLIMAGGKDHLALPIMTKKFYEALGAEYKEYFFYKNAAHTDFESEINNYPELTEQIFNWLDTYGR